MPQLFKNRITRRKDDLKDLLDMKVVRKKGNFRKILKFVSKQHRKILIILFIVFSAALNIYYFNTLTVMNQQVANTRAQIEIALQMRRNIVPALSVVVYQFINHEKNVFLKAVEARESSLTASKDTTKLLQGLKTLTGTDIAPQAISRFMAVAENYPQLVSSESYQLLIGQIANVENQIYEKRIMYNNATNVYNTRLSIFPVNIAGRVLGFRMQPYFEWNSKPEWVFVVNPDQGELPVSMEAKGD